ncbi:MAG: hypothetical protein N4J56_001441 [Chroococcidiopsis sp. SAG 2025]|nr:hypothetical protein [Chroococcidiopsis sp. SAG 2025]MDV2991787.1 hypothetical protein [Chroococcidiopsis sp. SAG 2025]
MSAQWNLQQQFPGRRVVVATENLEHLKRFTIASIGKILLTKIL